MVLRVFGSWSLNVGSGHCFSMPQAASNRAPFAADDSDHENTGD